MTPTILVSYPVGVLRPAKRVTEAGVRADLAAGARAAGVQLEFINPREFGVGPMTAYELDVSFRSGQSELINLYDAIRRKISSAAAFFVWDVNVFHPDFLDTLAVWKAFYSPDDPDASYQKSMPYAFAFDSIFTVTPRYNDERTMVAQFERWGCRRPHFVPLGAISTEFANVDEDTLFASRRDIPCVFVGTATTATRVDRLMQMRTSLGAGFRIFGDWGWRNSLKASLRSRRPVRVIPCADKTSLYQRTQVGINIHDSGSYGFGNRRVFELPMNGVMQICDFATSDLGDFFDIGREVVGYETTSEAIEQVRYYLTHDEERREIALNGYRRAKRQYVFSDLISGVFRTMVTEALTPVADATA